MIDGNSMNDAPSGAASSGTPMPSAPLAEPPRMQIPISAASATGERPRIACSSIARGSAGQPLGIGAGQRIGIAITDPGCLDLDRHLPRFRLAEPHGLDRQILPGLAG